MQRHNTQYAETDCGLRMCEADHVDQPSGKLSINCFGGKVRGRRRKD